jgi:hypothetical protein
VLTRRTQRSQAAEPEALADGPIKSVRYLGNQFLENTVGVTGADGATSLALPSGDSRGPAAVPPPYIDPDGAAEQAMELYDANHDGALSKEELAKCPAMLGKLVVYDQNANGSVESAEIAKRLTDLLSAKIALTRLQCRVTFRGRPLRGATVIFEPEPYLGDEVKAATGVTDEHGVAAPSIPKEAMPENLRRMAFVHCGVFKVRVTHPTIKLPARYNTATELGYETEVGNPFTSFALKDK